MKIANIVNNNLDKLNKLKDQYPLVKNALNETLGKNNILNSFNDKILNEVKIVQSHLSQANHYYKQHTYTLFWENIEKTGKSLSQFEFLVKILESCIHFVKHQDRVVKETNKETLENVKSLCHPIVNKDFLEEERRSKLKYFSIQLAKLDKLFAPSSKFEEAILSTKTTVYPVVVEYNKLVLRGLSNHKFALIYEQRAIRESIVGGFKNLGEMVQNVGNQLNDTLTTIDDSIRKEAENTRERMSEEAENTRERMSEEAENKREKIRQEAENTRERMSEEAENTRERMSEEAENTRERMSEEAENTREEIRKEAENKRE